MKKYMSPSGEYFEEEEVPTGCVEVEQIPLSYKWSVIKRQRNCLLAESDYTQLEDSPVDKQAYKVYRKKLRDIPQDFPNPDDVIWPVKPE